MLAYAPDVLVLSPCASEGGHGVERTLAEVDRLAMNPGWWAIPAVKAREVYVVDHACFSRGGPRLVDGVELLAHILHPDLCPAPPPAATARGCAKLVMEPGRQCRPRQLRAYFQPISKALTHRRLPVAPPVTPTPSRRRSAEGVSEAEE